MKALIVGGAGYIGSAAARALRAAGHQVSGVARNAESADKLRKIDIDPVAGDVRDPRGLADIARSFDGVIFTPRVTFEEEDDALEALLSALAGGDRALVYTSGTAVFAQDAPDGDREGDIFAEADTFTPPPWPFMQTRLRTEAMVLDAHPAVRSMVIRPPMVWGYGGSLLIDAIVESIRQTGAACYVGQGRHRLSNVHVDDLGELHRLAFESGSAGAVYHAAANEADFRTMAEWCADVAGCGTRSVNPDEAQKIWRVLAASFGSSNRSAAPRSRNELGWAPKLEDVVSDIRDGGYTGEIARALP